MANKNKNEKGVIIVHEFPRGKRTPSPSPYVMKLETFLRMNKIPYEPGKGSFINDLNEFQNFPFPFPIVTLFGNKDFVLSS